jgi:hypothetical protein
VPKKKDVSLKSVLTTIEKQLGETLAAKSSKVIEKKGGQQLSKHDNNENT